MFRVLCLVYGSLLDVWVFKIKKNNLVLFFENLVFNVNLFKVFVFKDINIKNIIFFKYKLI